jgi:NADH-quinone oxidoreductase subunit N
MCLAAFAKSSAQSAEAALKYYLFGGMSAALMLFGFSYLYGLTGTTNLTGIAASLAGAETVTPLLVVALVLVAAGLGFKVAAVPFHLVGSGYVSGSAGAGGRADRIGIERWPASPC